MGVRDLFSSVLYNLQLSFIMSIFLKLHNNVNHVSYQCSACSYPGLYIVVEATLVACMLVTMISLQEM